MPPFSSILKFYMDKHKAAEQKKLAELAKEIQAKKFEEKDKK